MVRQQSVDVFNVLAKKGYRHFDEMTLIHGILFW